MNYSFNLGNKLVLIQKLARKNDRKQNPSELDDDATRTGPSYNTINHTGYNIYQVDIYYYNNNQI